MSFIHGNFSQILDDYRSDCEQNMLVFSELVSLSIKEKKYSMKISTQKIRISTHLIFSKDCNHVGNAVGIERDRVDLALH